MKATFSERLLLVAALVICAVLVGYNAFYEPQAAIPTIVYSESGSQSGQEEEYQPLPPEEKESGPLNLNEATEEELARRLPGVGETLARRIVEYREQHHGFERLEDLRNVEGIGEATWEEIRPFLTLS